VTTSTLLGLIEDIVISIVVFLVVSLRNTAETVFQWLIKYYHNFARSGSVDLKKLTPIDKCHGAGLKSCRVVHSGGRSMSTNERRGGQLEAHRRFFYAASNYGKLEGQISSGVSSPILE
jgi:hypothetical protein